MEHKINLYEPAILVVGTKGKSLGGFQGLLPGSVSKYCLQHSPVPVIVVRPSSKRDKAREKRANDPDRSVYKRMLDKSETLIDVNNPRSNYIANDEEVMAAATISKQPTEATHPLAQVAHAEDSDDDGDTNADTLVDDPRSPVQLMKSPHLQNLESPDFSDDPSSDEDAGQSTKPAHRTASEIAKARGGFNFEGDDVSPRAQPSANPLDAKRTNTVPAPNITITVTDPNDPSRVIKSTDDT